MSKITSSKIGYIVFDPSEGGTLIKVKLIEKPILWLCGIHSMYIEEMRSVNVTYSLSSGIQNYSFTDNSITMKQIKTKGFPLL